MTALTQLIEILTLRRRPQDLSYDPAAAALYFVLVLGLSYISTAQLPTFSQPLKISLIQTVAQAATLYLFLTIAKKANRFIQTATALFGTMAILSIFSLIATQVPILGILALFATGWSFYIMVLIFRDCFETSTLNGVLIVIGLNLVAGSLTIMLLPSYLAELQEVFVSVQETAPSTE